MRSEQQLLNVIHSLDIQIIASHRKAQKTEFFYFQKLFFTCIDCLKEEEELDSFFSFSATLVLYSARFDWSRIRISPVQAPRAAARPRAPPSRPSDLHAPQKRLKHDTLWDMAAFLRQCKKGRKRCRNISKTPKKAAKGAQNEVSYL